MIVGEVTVRALAVHLDQIASGGLVTAMAARLTEAAVQLEEETRKNITARLTMRSRSLLTSVRGDLEISPDTIEARVSVGGNAEGLEVAYARIQELGGIVRPVKGKYLTIPLDAAKTGPGIGRPAATFPGLAFAQSLKGQPMLVMSHGPNAGTPYFLLVKSVEIKPKFYLRDALATVMAGLPDTLASEAAAAVGGTS